MIRLQYFTRRGCHLCELMLEELLPIVRNQAEIEVCDVDQNPEWLSQYDIRVPVIEFAGEVVSEYPLDATAIRRVLATAERQNHE